MSDVIPVATQHPVLLDVATKETMMKTGEPMAPFSFRGFRLHIIWTQESGVSPGPDAGPKDGDKPQATVQ